MTITKTQNLPDLPATLHDLHDLAARLDTAESRYQKAEKRFRVLCAGLVGAMTLAMSLPFVSPALAQGYGITLAQAATRIAALETKTASITTLTDPNTNQPTVRFSGVNVQVVSGSGYTDSTVSGLGNLIVGYNETRASYGGSGDDRTGSNNLVVGVYNNYSGSGGAVIGTQNNIIANYSSVTGGFGNTASGQYSSVSGGNGNTASALYSSVSGGYSNTASGNRSSVSGGAANMASTRYCSVSGGYGNTASAQSSSVSGGLYVQQGNTNGFSAGGSYTQASPGVGIFHSP